MKISTTLAVSALAASVYGQAGEWAQCGGLIWLGPTTCQPDQECFFINIYVSQCLPRSYESSSGYSLISTATKTSTSSVQSSTSKAPTTTLVTTKSAKTTLITSTTSTTSTYAGVPLWGQCGGINWTGGTYCVAGVTCVYLNPYHSQCLIVSSTSSTVVSTSTTPTSTTSATPTSTVVYLQKWAQCGGQGWTGPTNCAPGLTCVQNSGSIYFAQCLS